MFMTLLKQATSGRHRALEAQLPLLDPRLSRQDYQRFVCRFFGYYAPLEERLLAWPDWHAIGLDYRERHKTPRLVQDMAALGDAPASQAQVARCQALPETTTSAQVLGCLYVIEGATLGGQIILKHLHANLGLTPASGASFFSGYGDQTGPRWQSFRATLAALAQRVDADNDIIASANRTFETIDAWLFPKPATQTTHT